MIKGKEIYEVLSAVVPQYVAMILGFGSVRWWKILTPDQCAGVDRFVAVFALPFLIFNLISSNDPYAMNWKFLAGDSLQKVVVLAALFLWNFTRFGSIDWTITLFSIFALPNTIVMGVPLLKGMYGEFTTSLMIQISFLQVCIWNTLLLILFEYRAAKLLIREQFSQAPGSITTLRVHSDDGSSLSDRDPKLVLSGSGSASTGSQMETDSNMGRGASSRELHVFVGSTGASTAASRGASADIGSIDSSGNDASKDAHEMIEIEEKVASHLNGSRMKVDTEGGDANKQQQMPSAGVVTRLIIIVVWRKLIRNPNTWANILGLIWSLIAFRFNIELPAIIKGSITVISNTGIGMAMFSLGLFTALQPKLIACGKKWAAISMIARLLGGPAVIAATSSAIGIRGVFLQVEIVQAALPQAIMNFVFAKEYNLHTDILSTAVIFGMVVSLPVTIIYYVLLGL